MQINNVQSTPQFGMAFKIKGQDIAEAQGKLRFFHGTGAYQRYAIPEFNKTCLRGHEQLVKEQKQLKHFDIVYDYMTKATEIVKKDTGEVVQSFSESPKGITGLNHFGVVQYPGRELFARLFNPKKFLPYNVYEAGETAKIMDKAATKAEKMSARFDSIK
ncbi:MAG: hypothetical protein E7Z93_08395 [Cyanobacteria bacterium SIG32]|nr:hypothetical protein [Cyanobacteria bacterium SIG32]